jgi:hypothetical protein
MFHKTRPLVPCVRFFGRLEEEACRHQSRKIKEMRAWVAVESRPQPDLSGIFALFCSGGWPPGTRKIGRRALFGILAALRAS